MYRYVSFLNTADFPTSEKEKNIKSLYKVYINEDGKTIAHPCFLKDKKTFKATYQDEIDLLFKDIKKDVEKDNKNKFFSTVSRDEKFDSIKDILKNSAEKRKDECKKFLDLLEGSSLDDYIEEKKKADIHNAAARRKRMLRKVFFNYYKLNYWFTLTCDLSKFSTIEECYEKFETWIKNNANRYGVKIIGVYELGEENGRLHFHGFGHFPEGFFDDDFKKVSRFSEKNKCWQQCVESQFLREKFGINEFEAISEMSKDDFLKTLKYTCKYSLKQDCKRYYSKGLPDSVYQYCDITDFYFTFEDGIFKYVALDEFEIDKDMKNSKLRYETEKYNVSSERSRRQVG